MAGLAGIPAIASEQPNGAVAAGAHKDRTVPAKTRPDPDDAEVLDVATAAHDFEARGRKPQVGEIGIFEADVGLDDLAMIAWDDMAQVMDTN